MRGVDVEAEEQTIERLRGEWLEAENRKDVEATMAFMSDDVILHVANIPQFLGKDALREPFSDYIRNRLISTDSWSSRIDVSSSGDMAYDIGTSLAKVRGQEGPIEVKQKYLNIWKKTGGDWKCVASSWSEDAGG